MKTPHEVGYEKFVRAALAKEADADASHHPSIPGWQRGARWFSVHVVGVLARLDALADQAQAAAKEAASLAVDEYLGQHPRAGRLRRMRADARAAGQAQAEAKKAAEASLEKAKEALAAGDDPAPFENAYRQATADIAIHANRQRTLTELADQMQVEVRSGARAAVETRLRPLLGEAKREFEKALRSLEAEFIPRILAVYALAAKTDGLERQLQNQATAGTGRPDKLTDVQVEAALDRL